MHLRSRISGTAERPRLCVSRSNNNVAVQLVDDSKGRVLTGISSLSLPSGEKKLKRIEAAKEVGHQIAEKAKSLGIEKVVFDRAGYRYHGRVKAVADGARERGLKF